MRRALALAITAAAAAAALAACTHHDRTPPAHPEPPKQAIELSLPGLAPGTTVDVADERGHPLVIFMFTTWSLRAQVEAPQFVQMDDRLRARGLRVVGIALDRDTGPLVKTYVGYMHMRFPIALAEPNDPRLVAAFGRTVRVPRTVLLDKAGRVRLDYQGATRFSKLRAAIDSMLAPAAR